MSPYEALNSVGPPVQMRQRLTAFSRVSTGDSDIRSSCEMKDEPAFKPQQVNQTFFLVRACRCPFQLRQNIQGPSHISIAERSLHLRCLWKVGIPLESKPGDQLSSRDDLGYTELTSSCCAELDVPTDLRRCSRGISGVA